jgi:Ca2+-binding RTX toxin-like protein
LRFSVRTPVRGGRNPTVTETGSNPGAYVQLVVDGNQIANTIQADANGVWSYTPSGLADGTHTIVANEFTLGIHASQVSLGTASLTFTLDATAPIVSIKNSGGLTNHPTQTIFGAVDIADAGTKVSILDGTTVLDTVVVQSDGSWRDTITLVGDGDHKITAQDTDLAGNTGTSNAVVFSLDTTPPISVITGESLSHGKVTLAGSTAEANDTISVYDGSTLLGTTTTGSNGIWSFTTGKVSNAIHTYTANATDLAGNIGYSSNEAILGSSGADTLVGTSGNDIIIGNGGNDKITGAGGADLLTGGTGNVTFIYNSVTDSTTASPDTITDFRHNHDKIDFTNISGINASGGVPTFEGKLSGAGNFILNAHSVGYIEMSGNTEVLVNTTNNAEIVTSSNVSAANMEIVLVGINLHLTSTDFHHL